jgi:hypothetical protein
MRARSVVTTALIGAAAVVGCGSCSADRDGGATPTTVSAATSVPAATTGAAAEAQQFPEIVEATATGNGGTWTFEVTVSSPYDTPERYADGWRVLGPDGTVYGEHELTHDHAAEQPFTRTQEGVAIPDGIDEVTIEGRDLVNGYGGPTVTVQIESS